MSTMYDDGHKQRVERLKELVAAFKPNRPLTDWHKGTLASLEDRVDLAEKTKIALYQYTSDYRSSKFFDDIRAVESEIRSLTPWLSSWKSIKGQSQETPDVYTPEMSEPEKQEADRRRVETITALSENMTDIEELPDDGLFVSTEYDKYPDQGDGYQNAMWDEMPTGNPERIADSISQNLDSLRPDDAPSAQHTCRPDYGTPSVMDRP